MAIGKRRRETWNRRSRRGESSSVLVLNSGASQPTPRETDRKDDDTLEMKATESGLGGRDKLRVWGDLKVIGEA